jgi:hypothetical protein
VKLLVFVPQVPASLLEGQAASALLCQSLVVFQVWYVHLQLPAWERLVVVRPAVEEVEVEQRELVRSLRRTPWASNLLSWFARSYRATSYRSQLKEQYPWVQSNTFRRPACGMTGLRLVSVRLRNQIRSSVVCSRQSSSFNSKPLLLEEWTSRLDQPSNTTRSQANLLLSKFKKTQPLQETICTSQERFMFLKAKHQLLSPGLLLEAKQLRSLLRAASYSALAGQVVSLQKPLHEGQSLQHGLQPKHNGLSLPLLPLLFTKLSHPISTGLPPIFVTNQPLHLAVRLLLRLNFLSSNANFENRQGQFIIKHYAGDVNYQVAGMTDKNKDQLLKDLLNLVGESSNSFLHELFPAQVNQDDKRRPPTAGDKIKASANELVDTLMQAQPSYIRTIKPNENKSPKEYNEANVLHQIKYLGLQENVRIRRAGFAYRQAFDKFVLCHVSHLLVSFDHCIGDLWGRNIDGRVWRHARLADPKVCTRPNHCTCQIAQEVCHDVAFDLVDGIAVNKALREDAKIWTVSAIAYGAGRQVDAFADVVANRIVRSASEAPSLTTISEFGAACLSVVLAQQELTTRVLRMATGVGYCW